MRKENMNNLLVWKLVMKLLIVAFNINIFLFDHFYIHEKIRRVYWGVLKVQRWVKKYFLILFDRKLLFLTPFGIRGGLFLGLKTMNPPTTAPQKSSC